MGAAFSNDDDENKTETINKNKTETINKNYSINYFGNPLLSVNSKRLLPDDVKKMLSHKKYLKYKEKYENLKNN
jgi:CRISPR/Cas system-associated protein Cas5 (RAMP superfamily)